VVKVHTNICSPAAVLSLGPERIAAEPAVAVVVRLEVAGRLVEAVAPPEVVAEVGPVEEIGDHRLAVRLRSTGEVDGEVELEILPAVGCAVGVVVAVEVE
jgi:hypothetical protein